MIKNINQICLERLAVKIGIPIMQGWKISLSLKLGQKRQSVISTWIKRGVPKDFGSILENVGINPAIWDEIIENIGNNNAGGISEDDYGGSTAINPVHLKALGLTSKVMSSKHPEVANALMKNLEQFAQAVDSADELALCQIKIQEQDKKLQTMDIKIKELQTQVKELLSREPQGCLDTPGDTSLPSKEKAM